MGDSEKDAAVEAKAKLQQGGRIVLVSSLQRRAVGPVRAPLHDCWSPPEQNRRAQARCGLCG